MIKVLVKAFSILETLEKCGGMDLKDITEATKINKTTISNIIKTLQDIGYVERDLNNRYVVSRNSLLSGFNRMRRTALLKAAAEVSRDVALKTERTAVVATMEGMVRFVIATAKYDGKLDMDNRVYAGTSYKHSYNKGTGRLLLAYLAPQLLRRFVIENGFPTADEWPEVGTFTQLEDALADIRKAGRVEFSPPHDDRVMAAEAVRGPDGDVWAAAAVTWLPEKQDDGGAHMREALAHAARNMEALLVKYGGLDTNDDE